MLTVRAGRRTVLAHGAAACGSVLLPGCGPQLPDTVKIGVAMTLSGPIGSRGQDLLNGATLAVEQINDAGLRISGKPVKLALVAVDDMADNDTAKAVAQQLCDAKVNLVIGHTNSPQLQAALPVYVAHDMTLMTTTTQRTLMDQAGGRLFRLVPNDRVQARALAGYSHEQLAGKRVLVLVENTDYGREMADDMAAALKDLRAEPAERIAIEFKQPVAAPAAERVKAARADVVVLIGREQHAISLFERLQALRHTDLAVLLGNAARTDKVAQSGEAMRALFASATTIGVNELPAGERFLTAFRIRFKAEPVWGAHYAYDAVHAFVNTVRRVGGVDAASVRSSLRSHEQNTPLFQQMRFAASGEQANPTIGIYKAVRGSWLPQMRSGNW